MTPTQLLMTEALKKDGGNQKSFAIKNSMSEKDVSRHLNKKVPRGMPFNQAFKLAQKYQIDLNGMLNAKSELTTNELKTGKDE